MIMAHLTREQALNQLSIRGHGYCADLLDSARDFGPQTIGNVTVAFDGQRDFTGTIIGLATYAITTN